MLKVIDTASSKIASQLKRDLPCDQILVEGLVLMASIGVFESEYHSEQRVRFDVTVDVAPLSGEIDHSMENIVRYDHIVADITAHLKLGHIELVETLAEDIAAKCLSYDRAEHVVVTVAKLDVFDQAAAVGVRITRRA